MSDRNAAVIDGRIAHLNGTSVAKIEIIAQVYLKSSIVRFSSDILAVTVYGNLAPQVRLYTVTIICSQAKGAIANLIC